MMDLPNRWLPFLLPSAILISWQICATTGILDPLFFTPPTKLVNTAVEMLRAGDLGAHIRATFTPAGAGFLLGSVAGILSGVAMRSSRTMFRLAEPIVSTLCHDAQVNAASHADVAGRRWRDPADHRNRRDRLPPCDYPIRLTAFTVSAPTTSRWRRTPAPRGGSFFRRVYLPASTFQIFTGLRLAASRALAVTVSVEIVSARTGLGSLAFPGQPSRPSAFTWPSLP